MDILILVALGALLLFFMFNSQRKRKQQMERIKDNLVPGARVMTSFGLFGTVIEIDNEKSEVTIESGPGTVLRLHRQAIGQVEAPEGPDAAGAGGDTPATVEDSTADSTSVDDNGRRITDAELDAMNEARRNHVDADSDGETADGEGGTTGTDDDAAGSTGESSGSPDSTDDDRR